MAGEWRDTLLEDLADELTVGFVGSMTSEYVDDGIPFFRSKNVNPYKLNWDDLKYVSRKFHEKIKKSSLGPGDVVIVRTGKPGTACMIPDEVTVANCSDLVIVRPGPNLDKRFLVYFLNSAASHHINANLVGAVQQHFNVGAAKKLNIPLPPLHEQKAIAHLLGSLDDKIELNRRMNETLEGMAQALFKSWFVDFDPVIDNALAAGNPIPEPLSQRAETRRQALANGTANRESAQAFPASFRFTEELGWIPEGWDVKQLSEVCRVINGRAYKNTEFKESGTPIVRIQNLSGKGKTVYSDLALPKHKLIECEDLIFAWSATFGPHIWRGPESIYHYHIWKMDVDHLKMNKYLLYFILNRKTQEMRDAATGSIFTHLTKRTMEKLPVLVPSNVILEVAKANFETSFELITQRVQESQTLAKLRDVLLPKLISGELRIPQAEKMVEKAVA